MEVSVLSINGQIFITDSAPHWHYELRLTRGERRVVTIAIESTKIALTRIALKIKASVIWSTFILRWVLKSKRNYVNAFEKAFSGSKTH